MDAAVPPAIPPTRSEVDTPVPPLNAPESTSNETAHDALIPSASPSPFPTSETPSNPMPPPQPIAAPPQPITAPPQPITAPPQPIAAPPQLIAAPPQPIAPQNTQLRPLLPAPTPESLTPIAYHSSTLPQSHNLPSPTSFPSPPATTTSPTNAAESQERMKMTRLTDFEKGQIAALWEEYHHIPKIQERLLAYGGKRRSYTTIQSFVQRWKERNTHANAKAEGRPPKVGKEDRRRIQAAARDTGWSWAKLQREVAPEIGIKTLKRVVAGDYDKEEGEGAGEEGGENVEKVVTRGKPGNGGRPPRARDGTGRFAATSAGRAQARAAVREREKQKKALEAMQGGEMVIQAESSATQDTLMEQAPVMEVD
ncbi:hypothetical protein BDD12DRAFT_802689 [Trichophaea hybrida]|nr:hypothetical protein BDD12DRAFT_802689 [Trichophaea hybrida]